MKYIKIYEDYRSFLKQKVKDDNEIKSDLIEQIGMLICSNDTTSFSNNGSEGGQRQIRSVIGAA